MDWIPIVAAFLFYTFSKFPRIPFLRNQFQTLDSGHPQTRLNY